MKICASCHANLPKESFSKKQWKLDQRRCKVCIANNREVQPIPTKQDNIDSNTKEVVKALDSINLAGVEKISDEELFKQPPPREDCPICFIQLPSLDTGRRYQTCCGKVICSGCSHAPLYDNQGNEIDNEKCPFCRTPAPKSKEEMIEREKKRVVLDDPIAIHNQGSNYREGKNGFPQDHIKALELFHRAAELGYAAGYNSIGYCYDYGYGYGVQVDKKKANHYYELTAMRGNERARHNIGNNEYREGNIIRALRHYKIAVRSGEAESLKIIKEIYKDGHATKDDYTTALRSYQTYLSEIKSVQRDEAASAYEDYRYY